MFTFADSLKTSESREIRTAAFKSLDKIASNEVARAQQVDLYIHGLRLKVAEDRDEAFNKAVSPGCPSTMPTEVIHEMFTFNDQWAEASKHDTDRRNAFANVLPRPKAGGRASKRMDTIVQVDILVRRTILCNVENEKPERSCE
jgi:hypothetical protein